MVHNKHKIQVLQGSEGNFIRLVYNLDFTASNQNMPVKIMKATFYGEEILSNLSFRLAHQQDNV